MNSSINDPICLTDSEHKRPELAVLFHLVDVSRPRPAPPAAPQPPPALQLLASADLDLLKAHETPSLPLSASELSTLLDPPTITPLIERPLPSPTPHETAISPDSTTSEAIDASVESPTLEQEISPLPTSPSAAPLLTPASQLASRRKARTATSEDWFTSHGKYIALAFVLALIATIHFARSSRPPEAQSAEATPQLTIIDTKPEESHVQTVSAVSDSKIELHPPADSQFAATLPADAKSSGNDKLFEFPVAKKSNERVAAPPEGTPVADATASAEKSKSNSAPPPPSPASTFAPGYPTHGPVVNSPTSSTTPGGYPLTSAPPLVGTSLAAPAMPPTAPAYAAAPQAQPVQPTEIRSQFPMPVGQYQPQAAPYQPPAQAWTPPAPSYGPPAPYQPSQTARGPRNERNGSGNY